jgi:putative tricarboxylic transport membrane protein
MDRIKNMNEVLTGILLILVALLAFYLAWPLSGFTEIGLGSGFVPRMYAFIQLGLGALLIVNGFLKVGEAHEAWQLRPLVVLAAITFFCVTIERLGLVVAVMGLVLIACAANRGTKFYEALALAFGAAVFSALLFVKALGLSIPIWPTNFMGS